MSLNILIIQGGSNIKLPSGEQTVILNESTYLAKDNVVNVEYIDNGIGIFGKLSGLIWSFANYRKVIKFIDKYNPNIIHFHTVVPYLSLSVFFAAKRKNIKVVQTLHNGRWICVEGGFVRKGKYCEKCIGNSGLFGAIYGCQNGRLVSVLLVMTNLIFRYLQRNYKLVDKFIPVSDFIKKKHIQSGFSKRDLKVNNNGIDIELIEKIKNSNNIKVKPAGIVFAGRVSEAKGVAVLKYIMPIAKHHTFHIIGDGPELNELKKFSIMNGHTKVIFWGKQDYEDTLKIMSGAACTIVPSQMGEPFGLVAVESMALGVPVVSSNMGELDNLVSRGGGTVVNAREFGQFEKSIEMYLKNHDKAKLAGIKGREYVSQNLSSQSRVEALINIYKGL
jgi:glycosyltransferase involved in cell wall biosynthesis